VPTWRISANIEWRDPCGHAAAWLQGSDAQGRNDRLLYPTLHVFVLFVSEACFCEQPIVPVMGHD
ncbi:MAG: hypothetical protein UH084_02745, partial [Paludibacteraceae bacterium]|nr:hypothetical protein [Paludibacteraceae bacterium]